MNDTQSERLSKLSPRKREMLMKALQAESMKTENNGAIARRVDSGPPPLSFAQHRLWFLEQIQPGTSVYNIGSAVRLSGALDVGVLEKALNQIVGRHEVLRTTFESINGFPAQIIAPSLTLALPVTDLTYQAEAERDVKAREMAREEFRRPFDLSRGPLLRAALLRLGENDHVMVLTMHHIISDGWSNGLLVSEISALYEAFAQGKPSPLPELPIQYADFAVWQRDNLQGEALGKLLRYWKQQLSDMQTSLELCTDRPRPSIQTHEGATISRRLPAELSTQIKSLSQQEGATPFMTLLAAFKVLLHRYTEQSDLSVGSPIANRNRVETEGLIGFFVNTLVLRTQLEGHLTFRELLKRVQKVTLDAYTHQDLPFEKLVEELQPARDLSRPLMFQVAFVLQNAPAESASSTSIKMRSFEVEQETAKFDLTLTMSEADQGYLCLLEYNTSLYSAPTANRMLDHFHVLLDGIVTDPDRAIADLPILSEADRQEIFSVARPLEAVQPERECIHHYVEEQVRTRPEAIAVSYEGEELNYEQLNLRANQLAHFILSLGISSESLVAIYLDRSIEMIVSILAVLKSGAAYVPMDLAHPRHRLTYLLDDTQARVLITTHGNLDQLQGLSNASRIVCLDADADEIASHSSSNPSSPVFADSLAYVIYTSGSTGKPKGVGVTHRNVTRLLEATDGQFNFSEADVWTMFHSYAFDFSVWEIWGALMKGGKLVVVPYMASRSPEAFYELLKKERVTVLNQTPSAFKQLMRVDEQASGREKLRLRVVIFGGEALDVGSLRGWVERHGDEKPELVNMYGITETTVHVSYRRLREEDLLNHGWKSVIGRGMSDMQMYILDKRRELAPVGVMAEIYVGGGGLARGYMNRPEFTAERFIPDPYSGEAGARLYKSGDLAKYIGGEDIEYLGRIDDQVKVRGYRIELGEIESEMREIEGVKEAVAVVREERGEKRLFGYVVKREGVEKSAVEMKRELRKRLPEYMVPAAIVDVEKIPLTVNGKVDRKALPDPDTSRADTQETYVAPQNEIQQILAEVWTEVLAIDKVGIHDNFFAFGGDSMRTLQVLSRGQERGLRLQLQDIYRNQTIFELASLIEQQATDSDADRHQLEEPDAELAQILAELESLSEDDVRARLSEEGN